MIPIRIDVPSLQTLQSGKSENFEGNTRALENSVLSFRASDSDTQGELKRLVSIKIETNVPITWKNRTDNYTINFTFYIRNPAKQPS